MNAFKRIEPILTAVLTACAVVLTFGYIRREYFSSTPSTAPEISEVREWKKFATGNMKFGDSTAPLHIVEFSDFECPACRKLHRTVRALRARDSAAVLVTYRNYPLEDLHPTARASALAAQCAADQDRFEPYHDYLFDHQSALGGMDWLAVAWTVGVRDTTRFRSCLSDERTAAKLSADSVAAKQLAIDGTPLVIINGLVLRGAPNASILDSLLQLRRGRSEGARPMVSP